MNTRIRYFETSEPGIIQSVKTFMHPHNGARYKIRINETENEFMVIEDMSDTIKLSGRAANLHQVKIKAKKALEELGIPFQAEVERNRKSKVVADVQSG